MPTHLYGFWIAHWVSGAQYSDKAQPGTTTAHGATDCAAVEGACGADGREVPAAPPSTAEAHAQRPLPEARTEAALLPAPAARTVPPPSLLRSASASMPPAGAAAQLNPGSLFPLVQTADQILMHATSSGAAHREACVLVPRFLRGADADAFIPNLTAGGPVLACMTARPSGAGNTWSGVRSLLGGRSLLGVHAAPGRASHSI